MPAKKPPGLDEYEHKQAESEAVAEFLALPPQVDADGFFRQVVVDRSLGPQTVESLLALLGLPADTADPDADSDWRVEEFKVVPSEVSLNLKKHGRVLRVTNWHHTLRVRHRRPKPILADVPQPIVLKLPASFKPRPLAVPQDGDVLRALVFPDTQVGFWRDYRTPGLNPFHDRAAISIALQVLADYAPHRVDFLGDTLDLPMFQDRFPKGPNLRYLTQPAFVELTFLLWKIRTILTETEARLKRKAAAQIHIVPGNHDLRLTKAMYGTAADELIDLRPVHDPFGAPLVSIARIIDADRLGVTFADDYPGGRLKWNGNLEGVHGTKVGAKSGASVAKYLGDSPSVSLVFGHVHRYEMAWSTTRRGGAEREFMALSPGCLCRIDGGVPPLLQRFNWQQGLLGLEYEVGGAEYFAVDPIRIQGGRALWRGHVYEGQDYTEELIEWARAVGWENATDYARKDR